MVEGTPEPARGFASEDLTTKNTKFTRLKIQQFFFVFFVYPWLTNMPNALKIGSRINQFRDKMLCRRKKNNYISLCNFRFPHQQQLVS